MHHIILEAETDFEGWRKATRKLASNQIAPADVIWSVRGSEPELFASSTAPAHSEVRTDAHLEPPHGTFNVPAKFVELAQAAILHRSSERFALLYRLLWRLLGNHDLLNLVADPDVARITGMTKAVQRDEHRMHALVRFREVGRERDARYIAWFEPEHHIVELAAPFFARRFADMPWSILTPDRCAHWDGLAVAFTPGIAKSEAAAGERLEELWWRHAAGIFNPARSMVKATLPPKKNWRNLPEASIIRPLIEDAARFTGAMIACEASAPYEAETRLEPMKRKSEPTDTIVKLRAEAASCRACPLWKNATQTVFGEGPSHAQIVLVGEQPGDKEDLAGHPFVGPAGAMLDRALVEAGVDRRKVYITNAVKHFKFVPRGKIRLHQKPSTPEIKACRQWYERELAAIKPQLVVAMGATAAQCVFGKITPINKNRGHLIELDGGLEALVTVHPSYLLRQPDEEAKAREYQRFVDDLKVVAEYSRKSAHAA